MGGLGLGLGPPIPSSFWLTGSKWTHTIQLPVDWVKVEVGKKTGGAEGGEVASGSLCLSTRSSYSILPL